MPAVDLWGSPMLTVSELIELLKQLPQDTEVWLEGCDCWGAANGVVVCKDRDNVVLITRNDGDYDPEPTKPKGFFRRKK